MLVWLDAFGKNPCPWLHGVASVGRPGLAISLLPLRASSVGIGVALAVTLSHSFSLPSGFSYWVWSAPASAGPCSCSRAVAVGGCISLQRPSAPSETREESSDGKDRARERTGLAFFPSPARLPQSDSLQRCPKKCLRRSPAALRLGVGVGVGTASAVTVCVCAQVVLSFVHVGSPFLGSWAL